MSKHHRAFKLELAKRAQHESSRELGRRFNVSSRQIRYWSSVYRLHGLSSFRHSEHPYTSSFKLKVLNAMREHDWSISYTSAYFDLSTPGILFQWQKLYSLEGTSRLHPKKKGKPRMKHNPSESKSAKQMTEQELRDELDYLRAENAVLKKLEALAQAKKKQVKKRP
ncbi:helix-turn-helix domain-containing protein [Pseudidiomarina sp. 1APP75-32.1]|uniref:Helix-turn-helix domain-containing protein n=1 Tax=Pseudidiomarina terrestris TaxID=2820060 RepID=A0AAW7R151_9GAMM|nr:MULTISPECIES: helix-turn-helix domain-containing protein [unclassified Pseudidiomarina]MDN7125759.1 helix-turn-helix domain-containing protein [Pseudidiomarina sp. 1APP75-32.1]MDN7128254.1 helix-turn-helix domain-containing protein [Pseudidiomarina sp. 1APR75-33.1]MDN7139010.1 helix-turn-helix domain-containing protein [Pseudidiomarina sp. 1ASP75-14]MEA3587481.1 helix-turn-helix domain-containing protein [Pseudidiomarina sp. 1APP75-27a]